MREHLVGIGGRHGVVCAAEKQNRVLRAFIHLNDRVAAAARHGADEARVHAVRPERVEQQAAVLADEPGVKDGKSGPRCGDRLVQPLAAGKDLKAAAGLGLAAAHGVRYRIDVIDIERAEVQNLFHGALPFRAAIIA